MTSVVRPQDDVATALRMLYAPVQDEMVQVEAILQKEMQSKHAFVDELVRYGAMLGGKRLRPALLLLAAKATGQVNSDHLVLAAVIEMIHTATLVHDDVLDEADIRRHLATVNARWDNEASVLLGDYLFTHAFYLASTLDSTMGCRLIGRATNAVCEGEIRQKGSRANFDIDESEYLQIIEGKTAELCACACQLGALFAGASEDIVERMERYGRDLGIAFQIADDLLDVSGDETTTGKSLGTDFEKQKPTLPLIRALQVADAADREQILSIVGGESNDGLEQLLPLLRKYDSIEYTRGRAQDFINSANAQLSVLNESSEKELLQSLTHFVLQRSR